jgi:hypothetical protein
MPELQSPAAHRLRADRNASQMNISPKSIRFDDDTLWVSLSDRRTIAAPLAWFPRPLDAAPEQRVRVELSKGGLHWDALNEDISVAGWATSFDFSRYASDCMN